MGVYLYPSGTETELKNAYIGEVGEYTISNIPTTNTNVYINVGRSGKTIQSVTITLTATTSSSISGGVQLSSNNSNTNRYGLTINHYGGSAYTNSNGIRGRINGATDTWFRTVSNGFNFGSNNSVKYIINRDGNCSVTYNGTTTNYTATGTELTIIQTIMNLSNMNVYAYDNNGCFVGNKVNIEVTYS